MTSAAFSCVTKPGPVIKTGLAMVFRFVAYSVSITTWRAALAGLLALGYLGIVRPAIPVTKDLAALLFSGLGVVIRRGVEAS